LLIQHLSHTTYAGSMPNKPTATAERMDPRVRRTRALLRSAALELAA